MFKNSKIIFIFIKLNYFFLPSCKGDSEIIFFERRVNSFLSSSKEKVEPVTAADIKCKGNP